ncbi:MAG: SUMF1/EgtB/PvdO family nonheme iron enzyme [Anaerolineae bacterium]|nr:SUMF1/EgtB/PvdO family nonheme iron enzyme [Anaerolineae bacterium]
MARIFISYSRTDHAFARRLAADLSTLGADVWIDVADIPAGMKWSSAIHDGLRSCEAMLVIVSPDSMASQNVEDEWQYFKDQGKPLIPVLLRPADMHFQLHRMQYIDFHEQEYASALAQLHSELRRKGIALEPLTTTDSSVQLPVQQPLPVHGADAVASYPRSYFVIGAAVLAVVALAIILALSGVLGGGDDEPQATGETQAAALATETPTDQPTASNTPQPTATEAPTNTLIPEPTDTPSPPPPTATLTPLQAVLDLAQNFSGDNDDWEPFVQEFDGVAMVLVPAGCFMMGSTDWDDTQPVHEVCFDEPFWMDRYEVTRAQYEACVTTSACEQPFTSNYSTQPNHPINNMSWFDAQRYCEWRGARLPSEAEWEYAARGPDALVYPWGNEFVEANGVYSGNSSNQTAVVGSRPSGVAWVGTFDQSGNLWEWVADWYSNNYYGTLTNGVINPGGPDIGISRVLRGGAFNNIDSRVVRVEYRNVYDPVVAYYAAGFRCARNVD